MAEVALTFMRGEAGHGGPQIGPERVAGPLGRAPRQGFEFGKHQLNGIEIGTVGREKHESGTRLRNVLRTDRVLVDGEVIEDDEVARVQRWA